MAYKIFKYLDQVENEIAKAIDFHQEGYELENLELPEALKVDYSLF
jgi:predicted RNase H-like HicB family nuclease